MNKVIENLLKSQAFQEGYNSSQEGCGCDKCKIALTRHLGDPSRLNKTHTYWRYLSYCMRHVENDGLWLEFGVHKGSTIRYIANSVSNIIYGFDSFYGLPEKWVVSNHAQYKKGTFNLNGVAPEFTEKNIVIIPGWFCETIPKFLNTYSSPCAFVHIDCDIYSSTKTVLEFLFNRSRLIKGTVLLFDEFYNYPNYAKHEFKAFLEFVENYNVKYEWIAHTTGVMPWNGQQSALRIWSA